jgi:hypothetical protein
MTNLQVLPQDSSLGETNPASLDELFNRDPLKLSEVDVGQIVEYFRKKREDWKIAEATPKEAKAKAAPKAAKGTLSLADLSGLKL